MLLDFSLLRQLALDIIVKLLHTKYINGTMHGRKCEFICEMIRSMSITRPIQSSHIICRAQIGMLLVSEEKLDLIDHHVAYGIGEVTRELRVLYIVPVVL